MEGFGEQEGDKPSKDPSCCAISHNYPLKVTLHSSQRDLRLSVRPLKRMIRCLVTYLEISTEEIIVHFVSKKEISSLHEQFFNDPSPTDCITFPIDSALLGEIFICPKVALEYAEAHGKDPYVETSLYVIHCLLHLHGLKDKTPKERSRMRLWEKKCLNHLQEKNYLLSST